MSRIIFDKFEAMNLFLGFMNPDTQEGTEEEMARKYAKKLPEEADDVLAILPEFLTYTPFPWEEIQQNYNRNVKGEADAKAWCLHMAEILKEERAKASQPPA